MPLLDSEGTRNLLKGLFPGIRLETNLRPSGQRLVYFCHFSEATDVPAQSKWMSWGPAVIKISEIVHASVVARLEKEREILQQLSSTYYPRLLYHDSFSQDPISEVRFQHRLFITIEERVNGKPLSESRLRFNTEKAIVTLLTDLVDALDQLWSHPSRLVHRDLKPDNILIRPNGKPVVIDLGIVREEGSAGVTATDWGIGPCTPAYASPEQIRNSKRLISFKADLFALGALAYELMTGTGPFMHAVGEPPQVVLDRALNYSPPSLKSLGLTSDVFSDLIDSLLAKQPYMRPRTVAIFKRALRAAQRITP
jgi:eukaryotic-like serine/threonine-protein kinase